MLRAWEIDRSGGMMNPSGLEEIANLDSSGIWELPARDVDRMTNPKNFEFSSGNSSGCDNFDTGGVSRGEDTSYMVVCWNVRFWVEFCQKRAERANNGSKRVISRSKKVISRSKNSLLKLI